MSTGTGAGRERGLSREGGALAADLFGAVQAHVGGATLSAAADSMWMGKGGQTGDGYK